MYKDQEGNGDAQTAFRVAEKKYQLFREQKIKYKGGKARGGSLVTRPTNLSEVIDLHEKAISFSSSLVSVLPPPMPPHLHSSPPRSTMSPESNIHPLFEGVRMFTPAPETEIRAVYTFDQHPGLVVIPNGLTPQEQYVLSKRCLVSFPDPPSLTNHYVMYGELPGLWHAAAAGQVLDRGAATAANPEQGGPPYDKPPTGEKSKRDASSKPPQPPLLPEGTEEEEGLGLGEIKEEKQELKDSISSCSSCSSCSSSSCSSTPTPTPTPPNCPFSEFKTSFRDVNDLIGLDEDEAAEVRRVEALEVNRTVRERNRRRQAAIWRGGLAERAGGGKTGNKISQGPISINVSNNDSNHVGKNTNNKDVKNDTAVGIGGGGVPMTEKEGQAAALGQLGPTAVTLLRKMRWCTLGPQYDWTNRRYDFRRSHRPLTSSLKRLALVISQLSASLPSYGLSPSAGLSPSPPHNAITPFDPDAAIVNFYYDGDVLGGHRDDVELDLSQPIVTVSLGGAAIFLMGGVDRNSPPTALLLRSGDIVVLGGGARRCYHGVPRIFTGQEMLPFEMQDPKGGFESGFEDEVEKSKLDEPESNESSGSNESRESDESQKWIQERREILKHLATVRINISIREVA